MLLRHFMDAKFITVVRETLGRIVLKNQDSTAWYVWQRV